MTELENQPTGTERIAHNLSISTVYNADMDKYVHALSVVVSDVDHASQKINKSEQISMMVLPNMKPEVLIQGLREYIDSLESYLNGELPPSK